MIQILYLKMILNFQTIVLYDIEGNIINVNSWFECAHYVNGGWSNNIETQLCYGEKFFFLMSFLVIFTFVLIFIYPIYFKNN